MKLKFAAIIGLVVMIGLVLLPEHAHAQSSNGEEWFLNRGTLLSIEADSLVLQTRGKVLTGWVDQNTKIRISGGQNPTLADLSEGERIGLVGYQNQDGSVNALFIVRIDNVRPGIVWGRLTGRGEGWLAITRPDGTEVVVLVDNDTSVRIPEIDMATPDDPRPRDRIYAVGTVTMGSVLDARMVGRVPDDVKDMVYGTLSSVAPDEIEISTRRGPSVIVIDSETLVRVRGIEDAGLADLAKGDRVLAGGIQDGRLDASFVIGVKGPIGRVTRRGRGIGIWTID